MKQIIKWNGKTAESKIITRIKASRILQVPTWPLLLGVSVGISLALKLLALGILPSSLWQSQGGQLAFALSLGLLLGVVHLGLYLHYLEPRLHLALAEARLSQQRHQALLQKVSQVGHDIQSPLTALNLILGQWPHLPLESKKLLQNTIYRIQKIASDLYPTSHKKSSWLKVSDQQVQSQAAPTDLNSLLESLTQEKQVEYQRQANLQITWEDQSKGAIALQWESCSFSRILSNLINNAVEAGAQQVSLILKEEEGRIQILIQDNGKGLPKKLKLGLGLSHALKVVEQWGGKLQFDSQLDRGTTVRLTLPQVPEESSQPWERKCNSHRQGRDPVEFYPGQPISLSPSPARIS